MRVLPLLVCGLGLLGNAPAWAQACLIEASRTPPRVVELYTSEGCSSCPPADRWLSSLKGREDVLALAFHVTYWDRLGWPDRFAAPAHTQRQYALAAADGARQVYTPQVRVDGRDWRAWPRLPAASSVAGAEGRGPGLAVVPGLRLWRDAEGVAAEIAASAWPRIAAYWAVLEDGHHSRVQAGENAGETLRHDHVVRLYRPVDAWPGSAARRLRLAVGPGEPAHPRRVALVLVDPASGRPLQAASLDC